MEKNHRDNGIVLLTIKLREIEDCAKRLEKDVDDRDLWLADRASVIEKQYGRILELDKQVELLRGKLMAVTAERDAARAKVQELEKPKADPKPAITVSYSLINKDGTRIDGSKDSVMEVARLAKENAQLKAKVEELESKSVWMHCGDPVVEQVVQTLRERSSVGQAKYGVTLHASKEGKVAFLRHLLHEQCDACNYTQKLLNIEEGKAV